MRLLKIGVYYPTYLEQFYARRPGLAARSYAAQHEALMHDCFGSSDFWTTALSKSGYETCDLVANAEPLQKAWAAEHGVGQESGDWLFDVTTAQAKAFTPDVLLVADYSTFTAAHLKQLREECPSVRLVLGWCGAPYHDPDVFREWDIVLSCIPELVAHFRHDGHRSHHVNHAFDPRVLERIDTAAPPDVDFAFLGSVLKQNQFHVEREEILLHLVEQTNLQIWSDLKRPSPGEHRGVNTRRLAHGAVRAARAVGIPETLLACAPFIRRAARPQSHPAINQQVDARILERARGPLFGLEMFQQLHDSRVALNTHIDISPASASNMRLFEATGVGSCLLTDWKENLSQLFEPDTEVLTYRSTEECAEKVGYVLAHEDTRRALAAAGQRRALRDHNFVLRAARVDEIVRRALTKHRAATKH